MAGARHNNPPSPIIMPEDKVICWLRYSSESLSGSVRPCVVEKMAGTLAGRLWKLFVVQSDGGKIYIAIKMDIMKKIVNP